MYLDKERIENYLFKQSSRKGDSLREQISIFSDILADERIDRVLRVYARVCLIYRLIEAREIDSVANDVLNCADDLLWIKSSLELNSYIRVDVVHVYSSLQTARYNAFLVLGEPLKAEHVILDMLSHYREYSFDDFEEGFYKTCGSISGALIVLYCIRLLTSEVADEPLIDEAISVIQMGCAKGVSSKSRKTFYEFVDSANLVKTLVFFSKWHKGDNISSQLFKMKVVDECLVLTLRARVLNEQLELMRRTLTKSKASL